MQTPQSARTPWQVIGGALANINWKEYGPLFALLFLMVLGYIINPTFLTTGNITNVLTRAAFIGIIAVGMTFVITAGGLDLSVGSMAAFIAGVMIIVLNALIDPLGAGWLAIGIGAIVAAVLGITAGFVNGFVTTKGRVEAFIVTLGTMGIFRSLITYLADGGTLSLDFSLRAVYRPVY